MKFEPMRVFFILSFFLLFGIISDVDGQILFEDVTEKAGVYYSGDTFGSHWGDFNKDGFPDLWTGNHGKYGHGPKLFLNIGNGTFTEASKIIPNSILDKDRHGASWVDFDNDGDQDLFVLTGAGGGNGSSPNFLLINNDESFEDIATIMGLDYSKGRGRAPLWFDYNNDGLLDVILGNAVRPDGDAPTALFVQEKNNFKSFFEFKNLKKVGYIQIAELFSNGTSHILFLNPTSEAVFTSHGFPFLNILENLNFPNYTSSDFVIGDFNGDLLNDIFFSRGGGAKLDFNSDLFFGQTNGNFKIIGKNSGFITKTACKGTTAGDFDNDMDLDIYLVCGIWGKNDTKNPRDVNLPNILYENLGNGTFHIVKDNGDAEGSKLGVGETVTTVDYDMDGFLDLFVTNGGGLVGIKQGGPNQLLRNVGNENNWLEIDLIGTISNRDGIGAKVIASAGNVKQIREQNGGMHYRAQNHQRIHFGLGNNELVDNVIVYWPSGIVSAQKDIIANQILKITEPSKSISPKKQLDFGIKPSSVTCNVGLNLVFKTTNKVACVENSTVNKLIDRGWAQEIN